MNENGRIKTQIRPALPPLKKKTGTPKKLSGGAIAETSTGRGQKNMNYFLKNFLKKIFLICFYVTFNSFYPYC